MNWHTISPIKTTGYALAHAVVSSYGKGKSVRLTLSMSDLLGKEFDGVEVVEVQYGSGPNAGHVRIASAVKHPEVESHRLLGGMKNSRRVIVPVFEGLPNVAVSKHPCGIISQAKGEVILRLPLAEWEAEQSRTAKALENIKARAANIEATPVHVSIDTTFVSPPPKKSTPPTSTGNSIDILKYLQTRGHKVSRLAEGAFFQVDGERKTKLEAVAMINEIRKKADLVAVTPASCF